MTGISDRGLCRLAGLLAVLFAVAAVGRIALVLLTPASVGGSGDSVGGETVLYIVVGSLPLTAWMILRQQPRNRVGWLLMGSGWVWGAALVADIYARIGLTAAPGSLPRPDVAAALNAVVWAPGLGLLGTFLVLLFPDGRLPSPRWRPVAWLSAATIAGLTLTIMLSPGSIQVGPAPHLANPFAVPAFAPVLGVALIVFLCLLPLSMLCCAIGAARRFRRSRGIERLQMKWLATAGAVVASLFGLAMAPIPDGAWTSVVDTLSLLSFVLLPAAIGVAVLRHRLYGIDVVINRTLVYGSLTLTLLGLYVGSVLVLQVLLSPLTRSSDLAVAASTLAVAALFRPARQRIREAVDRRFYRSRYDAARTVDAFASRLRHELDLDALAADLRATVDETVHPSHVSLWLRP